MIAADGVWELGALGGIGGLGWRLCSGNRETIIVVLVTPLIHPPT